MSPNIGITAQNLAQCSRRTPLLSASDRQCKKRMAGLYYHHSELNRSRSKWFLPKLRREPVGILSNVLYGIAHFHLCQLLWPWIVGCDMPLPQGLNYVRRVGHQDRRWFPARSAKQALGKLYLLDVGHAQQKMEDRQLPDRGGILSLRLLRMLKQALALHHSQCKDRLDAEAQEYCQTGL